jgi:hypothetical protein
MSGKQQLDMPPVPNLGTSGVAYSQEVQNQNNGALRTFFIKLVNAIQSITSRGGGKYINFPYGAFSSYTTQTATANTATLLTMSTTDFSNLVSLNGSSAMVVTTAGIYNMQFSVQLESSDTAPQDVFIWLRQNGTDISGSTGKVGIPARKSAGVPSHDIKGWNYFLSMSENDTVQIYWSTTSANVTIPTYASSGSPTKPSTASVVATMTFVSNAPT